MRQRLIAEDTSLQLMVTTNNTSLSPLLLCKLTSVAVMSIHKYVLLRQLRNGKQIKGQDDIKGSLDGSLKDVSDQLNNDKYRDKLQQIFLVLSALPEQIEASLIKVRNDLCNTFTNEIKVCIEHLDFKIIHSVPWSRMG